MVTACAEAATISTLADTATPDTGHRRNSCSIIEFIPALQSGLGQSRQHATRSRDYQKSIALINEATADVFQANGHRTSAIDRSCPVDRFPTPLHVKADCRRRVTSLFCTTKNPFAAQCQRRNATRMLHQSRAMILALMAAPQNQYGRRRASAIAAVSDLSKLPPTLPSELNR